MSIKDIKKIQKLKREIQELEDIAYKRDGMYSHNDRFNDRYYSKVKQLKALSN